MGSFIDSFDADDGLAAFKLGLSTFADGLLGLACKKRSIRVHHEEFQDVGKRAAYITALWDFLRPPTQPAVLTTDAIEFANALGRAASLQLELNTVKCELDLLKEDLAKSQSELKRLNAAKDESVQIQEKLVLANRNVVRYKRELNSSKGAHYRTERDLERTQSELDRVKEELALIKDVLVQTQADVLREKCEFEWFKSELEQTREHLRHELEDRVLELERALAHERISPTINQDSSVESALSPDIS